MMKLAYVPDLSFALFHVSKIYLQSTNKVYANFINNITLLLYCILQRMLFTVFFFYFVCKWHLAIISLLLILLTPTFLIFRLI